MKYILLILALSISFTTFGQNPIDRSHAPQPGPAPKINIGSPASFTTSNGIKVFVVENHKVPKVSVSLMLKKKPIMENDKVGYVGISGSMMRRGTKSKTKAELDEDIDFLGGSISTNSGGAHASSLTKNFDEIFSLYSEIICQPAFRDSELVKVKKRVLSALKSNKNDPGSILNNVSDVVTYGDNHPYGEVRTPETIKNITTQDIENYYNTFWKPNIAYIAFVGDITVNHAKELVNKYLGEWQEADVPKPTYKQPKKPQSTIVYVADRPSAVQTNIEIIDPIELKPGNSDYFAARLMNKILGGGSSGRLFKDLREDYGFTYGAYSSLHSDPLVGSFSASAAVRTAVTDSSLMRFMYQLNKIRDEKLNTSDLDSAKNIISGNFALSLERPSRIASFALNIARYDLPKDYYKNYLKSIAAVTPQEVLAAAQKYVTPKQANIVLVGNSQEFADALAKYGRVQYVDNYGNPIQPPVHKAVPDDVTAQSVVNDYLQAIGGMDKINSVKDLHLKAHTSIRGRKIDMEQKYLLPNNFLSVIKLEGKGMIINKTLVKGSEVSLKNMGREIPLDSAKTAALKAKTNPFPETNLLTDQYNLKLEGIEEINGKEAYSLQAEDQNGKMTTYYFDVETGLELREVSTTQTAKGAINKTTNYSDYKAVNGLKFPFKMESKNGPITMSIIVDSIQINQGLTPEDFK